VFVSFLEVCLSWVGMVLPTGLPSARIKLTDDTLLPPGILPLISSIQYDNLSLVLYHIFLIIPLALLLTHANKVIISHIGYEKIMRCPSGITFSRFLFTSINIVLLVAWGKQLNEEEKWEREIGYWDGVVRWLEAERERVWEGEVCLFNPSVSTVVWLVLRESFYF